MSLKIFMNNNLTPDGDFKKAIDNLQKKDHNFNERITKNGWKRTRK